MKVHAAKPPDVGKPDWPQEPNYCSGDRCQVPADALFEFEPISALVYEQSLIKAAQDEYERTNWLADILEAPWGPCPVCDHIVPWSRPWGDRQHCRPWTHTPLGRYVRAEQLDLHSPLSKEET